MSELIEARPFIPHPYAELVASKAILPASVTPERYARAAFMQAAGLR
jgi:hypothetical protein